MCLGNFVKSEQSRRREKTRRQMNIVSEHDWSKTISFEWLAACQNGRWHWPFSGATGHVYESKKMKQKTKTEIQDHRRVGTIIDAINKTKNIFKFILKSWTGREHECTQSPFRMCGVRRYAADHSHRIRRVNTHHTLTRLTILQICQQMHNRMI